MCRSIHLRDGARPVHTQLVLRIAIVLPDTVGRRVDYLRVHIVRGNRVQELQVPDEDTLELGFVAVTAVRFT